MWQGNYADNVLAKAAPQLVQDIQKAHRIALKKLRLEEVDILSGLSFVTIDSGYLIHNPVNQLVKEPFILRQLARLIAESTDNARI